MGAILVSSRSTNERAGFRAFEDFQSWHLMMVEEGEFLNEAQSLKQYCLQKELAAHKSLYLQLISRAVVVISIVAAVS